MKRQKIRLAALLVGAAAGLTMLGANSAAAHPAPAGHRAASARPLTAAAPLLAMFTVIEETNPQLCPDGSGEALRVDPNANLVEAGYTEATEPDCDVLQVTPETLAAGWGDTTRIFADPTPSDPSTKDIFSINTDGDLTRYVMHYDEGHSPWLDAGTVIGSGWNSLTNVTYAGNGVFYAVDGDGDLLWYRFDGSGWANGGAGAVIGTGWQNFPLVFALGGAIYASTADGSLLWYGYSDPAGDSGT